MLYKQEPDNFQSQLVAVGCMVEYSNKLLFLRRHPNRSYAGKWGCPTGKQEHGETIRETAIRELHEETGISALDSPLSYCGVRFVCYPNDKDFVYHQFWLTLPTNPQVTLNPGEHDDFIWVSKKEALQVNYLGEKADIIECLRMVPA